MKIHEVGTLYLYIVLFYIESVAPGKRFRQQVVGSNSSGALGVLTCHPHYGLHPPSLAGAGLLCQCRGGERNDTGSMEEGLQWQLRPASAVGLMVEGTPWTHAGRHMDGEGHIKARGMVPVVKKTIYCNSFCFYIK